MVSGIFFCASGLILMMAFCYQKWQESRRTRVIAVDAAATDGEVVVAEKYED